MAVMVLIDYNSGILLYVSNVAVCLTKVIKKKPIFEAELFQLGTLCRVQGPSGSDLASHSSLYYNIETCEISFLNIK